jgi:hypothetical protein
VKKWTGGVMMKKQLPKEKHSLKDDLEEDLKARLLQMKSAGGRQRSRS